MRTSSLLAALLLITLSLGCSRNLVRQAQQYEAQGKYTSALPIYQKALARIPESDGRRRAEVLMQMGDCLYRLDRLPEAFSSFEKASEADPNNSLAHLRLGEMFLSAGSPERAREQAMFVLNNMARNNEALALLGAAWAAADNIPLAKQAYERVLEADPKRVTTAVALADLYNREDNTAKAREILRRATEVQPGSALPWLAMARLEEQEGNAEAAEDAYRHATGAEDTPETNLRLAQFLQRSARVAEAEQVLRRVDSQRRELPTAFGDFELASGHAGTALESYRVAWDSAKLSPHALTVWDRLRMRPAAQPNAADRASVAARIIEAEISAASAHAGKERTSALYTIRKHLNDYRSSLDAATTAILESEIALADNNPVLAKLFASSAVDRAPASAPAHYILGLVNAAAGNADVAQNELQNALDADTNFTPARLAIAERALESGDLQQADLQVRQVVRDDPGNFHGLIVFARVLLQQGKYESAAMIAHRAAVLDPSAVDPFLVIGESAVKTNRIAEALVNYERAVVTHPDSEEAMNGLLDLYRRGKVSFSAIEKLERVGQEVPQSSTLLEIAGRLYADHGSYTDAIRALTEAVKLDPRRATAARILAQLQLSTGDVAQASAVASRAGGASETLLAAFRDQQSGKWQQAAGNYERALHDGDQTGVAANNLAWLYAEHGTQLDRALELAGDAAKFSPNNPAVLDTLGFVLFKRREYSSAVKILETAARLSASARVADPDVTSQIRKHLSDAYYSAGQTDAASQIAQRFVPQQ
ncbi:MAG TPA: tetratricopeptide repeat protein [Terriglobales bacterium]|nr:tetratricopeptide repeat protein [Terriglobales bacterium]